MQIANQPDIYDYELTEFRRFSTKLILKKSLQHCDSEGWDRGTAGGDI